MGYVTSPWSLLMCLLLISIAAMVHSTEDMDVSSVDEGHSERHDVNDYQLQERFSEEDDKDIHLERRGSQAFYQIRVETYKRIHWSGVDGTISITLEFASGHAWPGYLKVGENIYADSVTWITGWYTYCGGGDHVKKVFICNSNNHDAYIPLGIKIYGPNVRDCGWDDCNWINQCSWLPTSSTYCRIYGCPNHKKTITCVHRGPTCSEKTC